MGSRCCRITLLEESLIDLILPLVLALFCPTLTRGTKQFKSWVGNFPPPIALGAIEQSIRDYCPGCYSWRCS